MINIFDLRIQDSSNKETAPKITCVSLMIYNCSSWTTPKAAMDKLNACHHKHLRTITRHRSPNSQQVSQQNIKHYSTIKKRGTTTLVHVRSCATDARRNTSTKYREFVGREGVTLAQISGSAVG